MTENDFPDYERQSYSFLGERMPEYASVEALLGVAYELRTANLFSLLDRRAVLMERLGSVAAAALTARVEGEVLARLDLEAKDQPTQRHGIVYKDTRP